jgi:hypothetical protein
MSTFLFQPENFDSLTEKGQAELTKQINEALKKGMMVSPRGEHLDGFGSVMVSVATMTPEECEQYKIYGGAWEFISGVDWLCERLVYEDHANPLSSDERGAA